MTVMAEADLLNIENRYSRFKVLHDPKVIALVSALREAQAALEEIYYTTESQGQSKVVAGRAIGVIPPEKVVPE